MQSKSMGVARRVRCHGSGSCRIADDRLVPRPLACVLRTKGYGQSNVAHIAWALLHRSYRGPERKQIALRTETTDLPVTNPRESTCAETAHTRKCSTYAARSGASENGQRIAKAIAVMRPCTGVDQHSIDIVFECAMDTFTYRRFAVGL